MISSEIRAAWDVLNSIIEFPSVEILIMSENASYVNA